MICETEIFRGNKIMQWLINLINFLTRIGSWLAVKVLVVSIYYPTLVWYSCKKPKRCPPIEDDILMLRAGEITEKIFNREISCVRVITAYESRVNAVNGIINAVVQDRFRDAKEEARYYDELVSSAAIRNNDSSNIQLPTEDEEARGTAKTSSIDQLRKKYPFFGVPVTVKSSLALTGCSHAAGRWSHRDVKATTDAEIVHLIRSSGAIPILVSNTPELCYNWETYNNVTGTTNNPYDTRRTPGGSSGGEAALLSSAASLIGLGSDVGGSLRLPASFCGVWGHKPTAGTVSYRGHYPTCASDPEMWTRFFTVGPMARYATDLSKMMRCIVKDEVRKSLMLDLEVDVKSIKINYMLNDGGCILSHKIDHEIRNAILSCASYFQTNGFHVEKVKLKRFKSSVSISYIPLLCMDGVEDIFDNDRNRSVILELFKMLFGCSKSTLGPCGYLLVKRVLEFALTKEHLASLEEECTALKNELNEMLDDNAILLYPSTPNVSHFHSQIFSKIFDNGYMTIFNSLGLPVTNCPVGQNKDGLPIGIQVVANSNCDRLSLAIAQELEIAFGGWKAPICHKNVSPSCE